MKIHDLLEEISAEVSESRKSVFGGRTAFDADYILTIVEAIRAVLPADLAEAHKILEQKDQILREANQYATRLVDDARQRAAAALDDHRIMQVAQSESREMLGDARKRAKEMRVAADDYALSVLDDLKAYFAEYQAILEENRSIFVDRKNKESRKTGL